ncbi:MAG: hypothetical protein ISR52_00305 [Rhodospirillales bacterium]|nr:hypothetical protein [Rhodospirillales bacterium]
MKRVAEKIEAVAHNPYLNVIVGVVLLLTGLAEAGETLTDDLSGLNFGAHHGVMIFGFVHAFKSLPAIVLGIELAHQHREKE